LNEQTGEFARSLGALMDIDVATPAPTRRALLRSLPSIPGPAWPLRAETAPELPQDMFWQWLQFAVENGVREPHAMTLSTVDTDGFPDARILILKDLDAHGWHFATDADSPKGRQLSAQPRVALTFYWPRLGRQVRIRGTATRLGDEAGHADFRARSPSSRATALLGRQGQPLDSLTQFEDRLAATLNALQIVPDTYAPGWSVYAVAPETVEFWQGDRDRRHRRLHYAWQGSAWQRQMLWP
jgi:pyridoxamine 5'-phosphate oxidase